MLHDSVVAVVDLRSRPRAIPLAMITMRKSTHGFPLFSYMSMGLCLAAHGRRSSAIINILLTLFFYVRTVSYGSSFFPLRFMACALRAWAI